MSSNRRTQSLFVTVALSSFALALLVAGCSSNGGGVGGDDSLTQGQETISSINHVSGGVHLEGGKTVVPGLADILTKRR